MLCLGLIKSHPSEDEEAGGDNIVRIHSDDCPNLQLVINMAILHYPHRHGYPSFSIYICQRTLVFINSLSCRKLSRKRILKFPLNLSERIITLQLSETSVFLKNLVRPQ